MVICSGPRVSGSQCLGQTWGGREPGGTSTLHPGPALDPLLCPDATFVSAVRRSWPSARCLCAVKRSLHFSWAKNSLHATRRARWFHKPRPECVLAGTFTAETKCLFASCEGAGRPFGISLTTPVLGQAICPLGAWCRNSVSLSVAVPRMGRALGCHSLILPRAPCGPWGWMDTQPEPGGLTGWSFPPAPRLHGPPGPRAR